MIHWKIENNIGIVSFDNEKGNLLSLKDLECLNKILLHNCLEVDGLILTGCNHSFCTGLQVEPEFAETSFRLLDEVLLNLYSFNKPLTIALSGHAIGAGFLMLCCADYVIASDNKKSKFGLPEVKLGLGLDRCMMLLLSTVLSSTVMKRLIYSSEYVSCDELLEWNVIDETQNLDLIDRSISYINEIKNKRAFLFCKKTLRKAYIAKMKAYIQEKCYLELADLLKY